MSLRSNHNSADNYFFTQMQELEMENSKLKEEMHKILMNLASKEDFNEDAQPTPAAKQFIGTL